MFTKELSRLSERPIPCFESVLPVTADLNCSFRKMNEQVPFVTLLREGKSESSVFAEELEQSQQFVFVSTLQPKPQDYLVFWGLKGYFTY